MKEKSASTPDSKKWDRQVAGREKNDLGGKREKEADATVGATGIERKSDLQDRKFGDHGPE